MNISGGTYMKQVHGTILLPLLVSYFWIQLFSSWVQQQAQLGHFPIIPIILACGGAFLIGPTLWFALSASEKERALFQKMVWLPISNKLASGRL
jgi:hypothetical protein